MSLAGQDLIFAIALERRLFAMLQGDDKEKGLYYVISHAVPTWDRYNELRGEIRAYESIIEEMREIVKRMTGTDDEMPATRRAGMN